MGASMGVQAKLGMGANNPVTEAYEFVRDDVMLEEILADGSAIRGTRSRPTERYRVVQRSVRGSVVMNPNPVELSNLLPRMLGAAASGITFNLAETLPSFYYTSDRVTKVPTFNGCVVGKWTFRATVGQPLELTLEIVGVDETIGAAGEFPALTIDETSPPFILPDLALTIGGTTYTCDQFEISGDNVLEVRFGNSLTPTAINPTDRIITVSTRVPYGDAGTLYGTGSAGLAMVANFTNGGAGGGAAGVNLKFDMPIVRFPKKTPVVDGRGEEWLLIDGRACKSGSTAELTVTCDSTP